MTEVIIVHFDIIFGLIKEGEFYENTVIVVHYSRIATALMFACDCGACAGNRTNRLTDEGNISLEEPPYNPDTNTYTITAGAWVAKVINDTLIFFSDDIFEFMTH